MSMKSARGIMDTPPSSMTSMKSARGISRIFSFSDEDIKNHSPRSPHSVSFSIPLTPLPQTPLLITPIDGIYPGCDFPDDITDITEYSSVYSVKSHMSYLSRYDCSDDFWFGNFHDDDNVLDTVYTIDNGVWICESSIISIPPKNVEALKSSFIITDGNWFCNKEEF